MASKENDSLYVMQNSAGLIKIGRAVNPELRRRQVENHSGVHVDLLLVIPGLGCDEWKIHNIMGNFRGIGEWFTCTEKSKSALRSAFPDHEIKFTYPIKNKTYPTSPKGKNGKKRVGRVVRRKMADGSYKTYRYGPYFVETIQDGERS